MNFHDNNWVLITNARHIRRRVKFHFGCANKHSLFVWENWVVVPAGANAFDLNTQWDSTLGYYYRTIRSAVIRPVENSWSFSGSTINSARSYYQDYVRTRPCICYRGSTSTSGDRCSAQIMPRIFYYSHSESFLHFRLWTLLLLLFSVRRAFYSTLCHSVFGTTCFWKRKNGFIKMLDQIQVSFCSWRFGFQTHIRFFFSSTQDDRILKSVWKM